MNENTQNITEYSDQELSMLVQNDEYLYNTFNKAVRHNNFSIIKEVVDEIYTYTQEQLDDLENDFNTEVEEQEDGE